MSEKERIVKNLAFYLLGVALFIGGYKVHSEYIADDQTSIEADGAEDSSGSL